MKLENQKIHILFIDDEKILCDVAEEIFIDMGFDISVFHQASDALSAFTQNPQRFDVVITDQTMPKISGLELAKKMLKIHPAAFILLSTGYSNEIDKNRAIEAGIRDFVLKPLRYNELANKIKSMLKVDIS